jgi:pyridoxine 5-phosphate synthase
VEYNIEGNPKGVSKSRPYGFIDLVKEIRPAQVTLVPDAEGVLTSNAGWDTVKNQDYLCDVVKEFKACGIRVSIFIDANPKMIEMAAKTGTDRVELYTESYASRYAADREAAIAPFVEAAKVARDCGLGLNAGHDLSLENLEYFVRNIPWTDEVSIGHALISDALYMGLENTVKEYLRLTHANK